MGWLGLGTVWLMVASGRKLTQLSLYVLAFPFKDHGRISQDLTLSCTPTLKQQSKCPSKKKRCEDKIWDSRGHCHRQTHKIHRLSLVRWPIACRHHSLPGRQLNQSWFLIKPFSANHQELVQSLHLRFLLQQLAGGSLAIFSETDKAQVSPKPKRYHKNRPLTSKFPSVEIC